MAYDNSVDELDEIRRNARFAQNLREGVPGQQAGIEDLRKRLTPNAGLGDALRNQPVADNSDLVKRLTPPAEPVKAPAVPPRNVPLNPPVETTTLRGDRFTTPNVSGVANEAMYAERTARAAAPAVQAAAPAAESAPGAVSRMVSAGRDFVRTNIGSGPVLDGAPSRIGQVARAALPVAARTVGPAIEAVQVGQVALDPKSSIRDIGEQAAIGVGRLGAAAGGAAIGAGLGSAAGPVGTLVGGVAGGVAGYAGGDAAINKLRESMGLGPKTPFEASVERGAAAAPAAAAPAATVAPAAQGPATRTDVQRPGNVGSPSVAAPLVRQPASTVSTGSGPRTVAGVAQAQPQYTLGENATEIIRPGGQRTVETFGANGPEGEVPSTIFNAGQTAQYRADAATAARLDMTDPKRTLAQEDKQQAGANERNRVTADATVEASRVRQEDKTPKPEVMKDPISGAPMGVVRHVADGKGGYTPEYVPVNRKPPTPASIEKLRKNAKNPAALEAFKNEFGLDPMSYLK